MPRKKVRRNARRHGQGSVAEQKSGGFRAYGPPDEDGHRQSKRFETREAAADWLAGLLADEAYTPSPGETLLGHYLEMWLATKQPPATRPQTFASYIDCVARTAPIANVEMRALTPEVLQAWLDGLKRADKKHGGQPLAITTRRTTRSVISEAFADAVPRYIATNPLTRVRVRTPKAVDSGEVAVRPSKVWERVEIERLLQAAVGTRDEVLYWTALHTAARLGELRGLMWTKVDLIKGEIWFDTSMSDDGKVMGPTKASIARVRPIDSFLVEMLAVLRKRQPPEQVFVFGHPLPYAPTDIRRVLGNLIAGLNKQGVPVKRLMPHSFRHTAASMLIADGADVADVAEHLGHSNPTITLRVYSHFFKARKRETAERMGRLVSPATLGAHEGAVVPLRRKTTS